MTDNPLHPEDSKMQEAMRLLVRMDRRSRHKLKAEEELRIMIRQFQTEFHYVKESIAEVRSMLAPGSDKSLPSRVHSLEDFRARSEVTSSERRKMWFAVILSILTSIVAFVASLFKGKG